MLCHIMLCDIVLCTLCYVTLCNTLCGISCNVYSKNGSVEEEESDRPSNSAEVNLPSATESNPQTSSGESTCPLKVFLSFSVYLLLRYFFLSWFELISLVF